MSVFFIFYMGNVFKSGWKNLSGNFIQVQQEIHWAIPEKTKQNVENILFSKLSWNFSFFYFTPGNSRQKNSNPGNSIFLCQIPRKFQGQKKTPGNSILFFLGLVSIVDGKCKYLKLVSTIFYQILISHQKIALQKL